MKKLLCLFLSFAMLLSISTGLGISASAAVSGDFEYQLLDDGTVEIVKYKGSATEIVVPGTINGSVVTSIGEDSFFFQMSVTSITLPDTITNIGSSAFYGCKSATYINIPDGVKYIGAYAFCQCRSLVDITIPKSVEFISFSAFENGAQYRDESCWEDNALYIGDCLVDARAGIPADYTVKEGTRIIASWTFDALTELKSVTIPASVEVIGSRVFPQDCSVIIDSESQHFITENGVLFNKDKTQLIQYFTICAGEYTVPESVIEIGEYAFYKCTNLTNIIIPENVKRICQYAFYYCKNLSDVMLCEGLEYIGNSAFNNCIALDGIVIPDSIKTMEGCFYGCESLTSITIPEGITELGKSMFCGCSNLAEVHLPSTLKVIGTYAFSSCSSLNSLDIPYGLTEVGYGAFEYCKQLESIDLPDTVSYIDEMAFHYCTSLKSFTFPKNIKILRIEVLDNTAIESVTIPKSVTTIEKFAFSGCNSLKNVYYLGTESKWNTVSIDNQDKANRYLLGATMHYLGKSHCVSVKAAKYGTISLNGTDITSGTQAEFDDGDIITLTAAPAENARFIGWVANGATTVCDDPEFTTAVLANVSYTPVFEYDDNAQFTVTFVDAYGNIINAQTVSSAKDIIIPAAPNRAGYTPATDNGWSLTDKEIISLTESTTISAQYEIKAANNFCVTAEGCTIKTADGSFENSAKNIAYDSRITVTNERASAWKIDGVTVAYGNSYAFYVGSDIELKPVFDAVTPAPAVASVSVSTIETDIIRACFLATRSVSDDCLYTNSGYIYGKGDLGEITLDDVDGSNIRAIYNKTQSEQFSLTFGIKAQEGTMTARAFLVYADENNDICITYAKPQTYTYEK